MLEDIECLVEEILTDFGERWSHDVTDRVFLAIEEHPGRLCRYQDVVGTLEGQGKRGRQLVNQYIGRRVKQRTTGVNRGRCNSPRSSLIKSYETH